jgi:ATP synthase I chain
MIDRPPADSRPLAEERTLRRIPLEVLAIAFVMAAASLLLFRPLTALFILSGGVFSALSFVGLKKALLRFLGPDKRRAVRSGLAFYLLRLLLLLAVFLIIILVLPRMILAFVAGFSSLVLAILIEAATALSQMKKWKD